MALGMNRHFILILSVLCFSMMFEIIVYKLKLCLKFYSSMRYLFFDIENDNGQLESGYKCLKIEF